MIKLIGTILSMILSPMGAMESLCEPIAKLLSKIFWFSAFTGFTPNEEKIKELDEKLDQKLEAGYAKCRKNKIFRKVDDGVQNTIGFIEKILNFIFDIIMICFTGGLWIFWMMIRKRRNNKKNKRA